MKPDAQSPAGMPAGVGTCEAVLEQVLMAHKAGTLEALLRRRPRATRWFLRRFAAPARTAVGDAFADDPSPRELVQVLLGWALAQLRPDAAPLPAPIDRSAWLDLTAWRPLLALACHYGFVPAPDYRDVYFGRPDEPAAQRLGGLWDVAPSSFYRYLEKGRRLVADVLLDQPLPPDRFVSLCDAATDAAGARLHWPDRAARLAWHARQADAAQQRHDARAALWHAVQARDPAGVTRALQRFSNELAADAHTDAVLRLLPAAAPDTRSQVMLLLAKAAIARVRGAADQERRECERALRLAAADDDKLMLGIVYGALGRLFEARDLDRSFACFQQAAVFLDQVDATDPPAAQAYLATLAHLAWLYTLRNDPRARAVLDRAAGLRDAAQAGDDTSAMLEQAWGEYWRRCGDLQRALEAGHKAMQIYERTGNRQQLLRTYGNLALLYGQAHDHERAIDYSRRVLAMAETAPVDPETVASTHINLGAALFWQHRLDEAIRHYGLAAECARAARLRVVAGRAHYNLAEAHYLRFKLYGRAEDERLGDSHTDAALAAWPDDGEPSTVQATRELKREVLGRDRELAVDQLLPGERAAHFEETGEVQRQRARLAVPQPAEVRVEAHLAIAAAYVAIAVKEREAAVALIEEHGLHERFGEHVASLRAAFERSFTDEQRLASRWAREAKDLLAADRCWKVVRHLAESGSINKSAYVQLCGVGPATASKHLGLLTERGLLVQTGRGPSTRYALPP